MVLWLGPASGLASADAGGAAAMFVAARRGRTLRVMVVGGWGRLVRSRRTAWRIQEGGR